MKLKTLLLSGLVLLTCSNTLAQTPSESNPVDKTSLITNPSFEKLTTGWTTVSLQSQTNTDFRKKKGSTYMEKWVGKGGAVGNASARQVLKDLPAGVYRLTVGAQNLDQNNTTAKCAGAYIFAGTEKTQVYVTDDYSVTFTHIMGDVEIGFVADNAKGNWIAVDNFRLYLVGEAPADQALGVLNAAIAKATGYYGDGSGNEAAALKAVIDASTAVSIDAAATVDAMMKAAKDLETAIVAYRYANVSENSPIDLTADYIVNPSFESATTGWTTQWLVTQSNNSFKKKGGTYYLEKWTGSGSVGDASVQQTLRNLPFGIYKLTVAAQNYSQSSTSKKNTGAYIFAADQQTTVYTPNDYSVTFSNITDEAEIGFVAKGATGNWLAVDNFRLYLIGNLTADEVVAEVQRLITEAESLDIPEEISADYQLTQQLTDALAEAKKITAASPAADVSRAVKALMAATTAERVAIDKALFAYHIANATEGTGAAPKVTQTNPYVATGATQALMRAAMTGANILERGVCWSKERQPTVLDNRSTKVFNLKGQIYHITGMEPSTVYYLRPYAINKTYQVAYGEEVKIITHPKGTCTWSWDEQGPDEATNTRCRNSIKETIDYFNEWTGIMGFHLSGHYVPGAGAGGGTADCSYGGWMRISQNQPYQAIGTVLHETGHGVGVGTTERWRNDANTRENTGHGAWLGREANKVLRFLENCDNSAVFLTGDGVHGWGTVKANSGNVPNATISYDWFVNGADKDKHDELQYIGGMCLLHGLFVDGLCPTTAYDNGISGYTFNFDDQKKYYLMSKNAQRGLGTGVLYQRTATSLAWTENLTHEAPNDSAAWYMEYNPVAGYYLLKNVATGQYISHSSSVTMRKTDKPGTSEYFQLMPDRTDVSLGSGKERVTTHGYWLTWNNGGAAALNAAALQTATGYGAVARANFNFSNSATAQQWIIISEDELAAFQALLPTAIQSVSSGTKDAGATESAVYDLQGRRIANPGKGLYIVDGKKVVIK